MYIGIVIWLFLCATVFLQKKVNFFNLNEKLFRFFFFFACALFMGLRSSSVGADTETYASLFYQISSKSISTVLQGKVQTSVEVPYQLFMKFISLIYGNYYFFQIVSSFLYIFLITRFIKKMCLNQFLAAVLFLGMDLFLNAFNLQRQFLAIALELNGWLAIKEKKKVKASFFFLIGVAFHRTAILFLLANLIYFMKDCKKLLKLMTVVAIVLAINYGKLMPVIQHYLPIYSNYYRNVKVQQSAGFIWVIWGIILIESVIVIMRTDIYTGLDRISAIFSLIFILFNIIGLSFNYAERIGLYFLPFTIILFERFKNFFSGKYTKALYTSGIIFSFTVYFIISSMSPQYHYSFFFI